MNDRDDFDLTDTGETFTHDELVVYCEKEWEAMSDDEHFMRLSTCDPTFYQYVLSHLKKGDTVFICEPYKEFEIVKRL